MPGSWSLYLASIAEFIVLLIVIISQKPKLKLEQIVPSHGGWVEIIITNVIIPGLRSWVYCVVYSNDFESTISIIIPEPRLRLNQILPGHGDQVKV